MHTCVHTHTHTMGGRGMTTKIIVLESNALKQNIFIEVSSKSVSEGLLAKNQG